MRLFVPVVKVHISLIHRLPRKHSNCVKVARSWYIFSHEQHQRQNSGRKDLSVHECTGGGLRTTKRMKVLTK